MQKQNIWLKVLYYLVEWTYSSFNGTMLLHHNLTVLQMPFACQSIWSQVSFYFSNIIYTYVSTKYRYY